MKWFTSRLGRPDGSLETLARVILALLLARGVRTSAAAAAAAEFFSSWHSPPSKISFNITQCTRPAGIRPCYVCMHAGKLMNNVMNIDYIFSQSRKIVTCSQKILKELGDCHPIRASFICDVLSNLNLHMPLSRLFDLAHR